MEISDRIKLLRKELKLTQNKLAERSGIHLVSIKKYETNKMKPERHAQELAAGLNVSEICINGADSLGLRVQTKGDVYAFLISLIHSKAFCLDGKYGDNGKLMPETIKISLNPAINDFVYPDTSTVRQNLQITNLDILKNLSEWHYLYKLATKEKDEEKKQKLNDELEAFELKLFSQQKSLK